MSSKGKMAQALGDSGDLFDETITCESVGGRSYASGNRSRSSWELDLRSVCRQLPGSVRCNKEKMSSENDHPVHGQGRKGLQGQQVQELAGPEASASPARPVEASGWGGRSESRRRNAATVTAAVASHHAETSDRTEVTPGGGGQGSPV